MDAGSARLGGFCDPVDDGDPTERLTEQLDRGRADFYYAEGELKQFSVKLTLVNGKQASYEDLR